jgi:hypothetical protein
MTDKAPSTRGDWPRPSAGAAWNIVHHRCFSPAHERGADVAARHTPDGHDGHPPTRTARAAGVTLAGLTVVFTVAGTVQVIGGRDSGARGRVG